ncbi:MAG TPA: hypothetical protein VEK15_32200 [Vicinamibacteria bacterium]|nr:hypothetical protein [Vicinamibacteria bacterium]
MLELDPAPYRVPTLDLDARLRLADGTTMAGTLFLAPGSSLHPGPESLDEYLARSRRFLPVRVTESGRTLLVNRDLVQLVEAGTDAPVLARLTGEQARSVDLVRLELTDGHALEGAVESLLPVENPRLSDFFNLNEDFFPVVVTEGITYVNKRFVSRIWL